MENKHIIILLLVVIIVLAAAIGWTLLSPAAKEPTKIKITSEKSQYEDDGSIEIKLTDSNKTALSKEIVNITITNSKGKVVVDDVIKTNSKGKAKFDLDLKKGKYTVNVTYGGNENYTASNATQKLTIKEEVKQTTVSSNTMYNGRDLSGGSGESVEVTEVHDDSGVVEGYKGGRKGVWTPSGAFIEEGGGY